MIKKQRIKFIDLGLPSGNLWGDRNLKSKSIFDQGAFYMWGVNTNILIKDENKKLDYDKICSIFDKKNYLKERKSIYYFDPSQVLKDCVTPGIDDFNELIKYTTIIKSEKGFKLSSVKNNNKLFLPFTGFIDSIDINITSYDSCCFWTSTKADSSHAFDHYFNVYNRENPVTGTLSIPFHHGLHIRPVKKIYYGKETKN